MDVFLAPVCLMLIKHLLEILVFEKVDQYAWLRLCSPKTAHRLHLDCNTNLFLYSLSRREVLLNCNATYHRSQEARHAGRVWGLEQAYQRNEQLLQVTSH